ncbi:hypothetical protein ACFL4F_02180 [Candidatus Margulisiibacteriota bacterium]
MLLVGGIFLRNSYYSDYRTGGTILVFISGFGLIFSGLSLIAFFLDQRFFGPKMGKDRCP